MPGQGFDRMRHEQPGRGELTFEGAVLMLTMLREVTDVLPIVKTVAAGALLVVDSIQQYKSNNMEWKRFAEVIAERTALIIDRIAVPSITPAETLLQDILKLSSTLENINSQILEAQNRSKLRKVIQARDDPRALAALKEQFKTALDHFSFASHIDLRLRLIQDRPPSYNEFPNYTVSMPPKPSVMCGREQYVESVVNGIVSKLEKNASSRLVIHGPGGLGKTSVALTVIHHAEIRRRFGKHIYFISCEAVATPGQLLAAVSASLRLQPSQGDLISDIKGFLSEEYGPFLLLFDNFETCWQTNHKYEVQQILEHLGSLDQVSLILTMRGKDAPGGVLWDLIPDLGTLKIADARQIFLMMAPQHPAVPLLDELLQAVECMPLAVTLLAQLARQGESTEILHRRWHVEQTRLLDTGGTGRHFSVDTSVALSISSPLMKNNPNALRLLTVLSRLPDGLSRRTFDRIDIVSKEELYRAALTLRKTDLAQQLSDGTLKSLAPIRLHVSRFHQARTDDLTAIQEHYIELAELGEQLSQTQGEEQASSLLRPELGNIQVVLSDMIRTGASPEGTASAVLNISKYLYETFPAQPPDLLEELVASGLHAVPPELAAGCLMMLAMTLHLQGDYSRATSIFHKAESLFFSRGVRQGAVTCMYSRGDILRSTGQYRESRALLEAAIVEYRNLGDDVGITGEAACLFGLADMMETQGECQDGLRLIEQARSKYAMLDDSAGVATCVEYLADVAILQGRYLDARVILDGNIRDCRNRSDDQTLGSSLLKQGQVCCLEGSYDEALAYLNEGLEIAETLGSKQGCADCQRILGTVAIAQGEADKAELMLEKAMAAYNKLGDRLHIADTWVGYAEINLARGGFIDAKFYTCQAREAYGLLGCRRGLADCCVLLAKMAHMEDDRVVVANLISEAEAIFEYLGNLSAIAWCGRGMNLDQTATI